MTDVTAQERQFEPSPSPWALVTGGSRGIGRAVALELAARGWNLAVGYLQNDAAAESVAAEARNAGSRVLLHKGNLAKARECAELIERIAIEAKPLSGLVHCAALGALAPTLETRPSWWKLTWDTHVGALVELVAAARPIFADEASVVAVSSLGSRFVTPGYASIGAAKGGLEVLVRYLAVELAPLGVNVNAVCGGPVDTDSLRSFPTFSQLEEESRRRPSSRMGQPEDVAPVVTFLMTPEARWIRGQVIVVDGGFSLY